MVFILMFMPASLAVLIEEKLKKEKKDVRSSILSYFAYTFIITLIMSAVIYFINSDKFIWYQESTYTYNFCFRYGLLSFLLAIILPCIVYVIPKVVQINIEVKERKKNAKKSSKNNSKNYKRKH